MITLTAQDIADVTSGQLRCDPATEVFSGVTTDSREVSAGYLFVAKPGETTDGHHFIPKALDSGATLVLCEREVQVNGKVVPSIIVKDVILAMGLIAAEIVKRLRTHNNMKVVAITGSAGKTTTKDLLNAIFSQVGPTVAPQGSYNSEVGVPLTVFKCTEETQYLVVEMGADAIGNIRYLCNMVHPDVGVVLIVGTAHAGGFGGADKIAIAKGEMVEDLGPDQIAVLNADDAQVAAMKNRTKAPICWFSSQDKELDNVVVARNVKIDDFSYPHCDLIFPDGSSQHIDGHLMGEHHVTNMLAAAAAAYSIGINTKDIAQALNTKQDMSKWRMQRDESPAGFTVINDAYNANPESMKAALQTLAKVGQGRRTWAVLGEMLELGDDVIEQHDSIGRQVVRLNISKLLVVGQGAKAIFNAAHLEGSWGNEAYFAEDFAEAKKILLQELLPDDVVLFKSSNGSKLGYLGEEILELPPSDFKNMQE
ncbi:MAG: UDP-N-acetylmuramoyl-tripeptide--D-alanyl-D-alanine ligase [Micrococcaceae bacterium]